MSEKQKPQLDRFGVAAALQEIAQLMDLKGGQNRFKAKAYNAGARAIQAVADLDRLVREDRLTTLPRIGDALASQIKQLYLTGESSVLNGLRQEFPKGVIELSSVQGFGPKTAQRLLTQLSTPVQKPKRRLYLHHAWSTADQCIEYLKVIDGVVDVSVAGSLRRWEETVDVIDIVAGAKDPAVVVEKFQEFPLVL